MENVYYKAYPQEPPPAYEDIETGGGDFPAPPVHHQSARDFPAQAFPHQSAVSVIEPTGVSYTAAYPPHVVIAQPQNALVSVGTFSQPQYGLQPQNALVGVGTVEQPPYGLQPQNVMVGVGTVEQPPEAPPSHLRLSTFACLACFWCWCVAVAAILKSSKNRVLLLYFSDLGVHPTKNPKSEIMPPFHLIS